MIGGRLTRSIRTLLPPLRLREAPEFFGPTDINAQSGNQRLSVALNDEGTITVLRWPRPSFFNHVKYHTTRRADPRYGAHPNEGMFLGLRVETDAGAETTWLRDWTTTQWYDSDGSDTVVTEHRSDAFGLTVRVVDTVAVDEDVLLRAVTVRRDPDSPVESASLLAFAHFHLGVSKKPKSPIHDLRRHPSDRTHARYRVDVDAVVATKRGVDESTDVRRRVAVALGFDQRSDHHQVGRDAFDPRYDETSDARDAYESASAGEFPGDDAHSGEPTAALATPLAFEGDDATATVVVAVAIDREAVSTLLGRARTLEPSVVAAEKAAWFDSLLADAPMPATDDPVVRAVARRALVTLVTNYDPVSGAVVASIATQSPYAQDWPRDGAFCNHVLNVVGLSEWADKRNRWYAALQRTDERRLLGHALVPKGNWVMNYYADGVAGGPIPWEIDQTGLTVWTLWDHYRATGDERYLREVYPAIRRAADFLAGYRDATTGLHRAAHEDDNVVPSRTIHGASTVWLALNSALQAARALGAVEDAARYRRRRDELQAAIDAHLWDPEAEAYSSGKSLLDRLLEHRHAPDVLRALPILPGTGGNTTLAWPARFAAADHPRMRGHLDHVWSVVEPSFAEPTAGQRRFGMYESKALVALATGWRDDPERLARVRRGVGWIAHNHATPDTHVLGEAWIREDGRIRTAVSQPHTFTQLLFYYASVLAFPASEQTVDAAAW
ncbi:Glycosyl hydrolases family 15 [Halogranum amylolyticum]|uniref:Glycosyl hydrolases family 15 n=1 Tax=Halogranum amylolyticum TaxID=660520 RepID=A0A1H8MYI4_9EURY|nr:glycoside hydrolase family 15 protein [Halogranum amylolyticum]SEO22326.1 Glycosyl hydrolases family 15 [Halogranum amylolyticum]